MSNFDRIQRTARTILRSLSFCAPSYVYPPSHWPPAVEPGVWQSSSTVPSGLHRRSSTQAAPGQHSVVSTRGFRTSPPDVFAGVGTSAHGPFIKGDLEDDDFEVDDDPVQDGLGSPLWKSEQEASLGTGVWRINDCKES
ncbi:hypothetical protein OsI_13138 [Oryza sativa Indica Group]|uniref:Uncharacterized protein n=1 Tax=Oryza sativa subsp. indica TaxID=39946 RepID=B8APZ5_ORYSI|nr:hypothetical protein OsI_13138 [Oryza sativa Indica Group]